MNKEKFMRSAIAEAKKSKEPLPCGCVIVKSGEIVAKQFNRQRSIPDVTAHAEILAIREACKKLGSKNLAGCFAFCSCEPCLMCLSAMVWAKIDKLYFAVPLLEANNGSDNNFSLSIEDFLERAPRKLDYQGGILQAEAVVQLYS